jgi:hypothetical protein
MNLRVLKYFIVFILLLSTFILVNSSNVNATCNVWFNGCYKDANACTVGSASYNQYKCRPFVDVDAPICTLGNDPKCMPGCCCPTSASAELTLSGLCNVTRGTFNSGSYTLTQCQNFCSSVVAGSKYNITGTVTIVGTGLVSGAHITLNPSAKNNNTISGGTYSLYNVDPGTYTVTAEYSGCNNNTQVVIVNSNVVSDITIKCDYYSVSGNVNYTSGGISGAEVKSSVGNIISGTNGAYTLSNILKNTAFDITANKTIGVNCFGTIHINPVQSNLVGQNITLVCNTYTFNGTIKKRDNSPLSDATVSSRGGLTTGNAAGFYNFNSVTPGSITVTAVKNGIAVSGGIMSCSGELSFSLDNNYINKDFIVTCCTDKTYKSPCIDGQIETTVETTCDDGRPLTNTKSYAPCSVPTACEWNLTWTGCAANAETESAVPGTPAKIIANGCDPNIITPQPELVRACPTQCGDGNLNVSRILNGFVVPETCDYNYKSGIYNVSDSCFAAWQAADISNPKKINFKSDLTTDATCYIGNCTCKTPPPKIIPTCVDNPGNLSDLNISHIAMQHAFNVSWNITNQSCANYVSNFSLRICNNATGACMDVLNNYVPVNNSISNNSRAYLHNASDNKPIPIVELTEYCYELTVTFNDSIVDPAKRKSSMIKCIKAGDEKCMSIHTDSWCTSNKKTSCYANNTINIVPTICSATEFCTNVNGNAECVYQPECNLCNGIFGILSYSELRIPSLRSDANLGKLIWCPSLVHPNPNPSQDWFDSSNLYGCYLDYSMSTTVDQSYDCDKVLSCYNYLSKDSCENDYCNKFNQTGANGCGWQPYNGDKSLTPNIFGKGVCRPKNESEQQCGLCNDNNPLKVNRIFSNCTKDICGLYGNCFFNTNGNNCMNARDVTCPTYTLQDDCIGTSRKNVSTVVDWNLVDGLLRKVSGTNVRINSSDAVGLGVCYWDGSCKRNTDNKTDIVDCKPIALGGKLTICTKDYIAPVTKITNRTAYGLLMDLNGEIEIQDNNAWPIGDSSIDTSYINIGPSKTTWMYYCVSAYGVGPCYPDNTMNFTDSQQKYKVNLTNFGLSNANNSQLFTMYYFSEDPAKNLELIKSFTFKLDTEGPNVNVNIGLDPYKLSRNQWLTNITVDLQVVNNELSPPVECKFTMHPPETIDRVISFNGKEQYNIPRRDNPSDVKIYNIATDRLHTAYPELVNGAYTWELDCFDAAKNPTHKTGSIQIDGDLRINNPIPKTKTFTTRSLATGTVHTYPVNISVNTTGPGLCKYNDTTPSLPFNSASMISMINGSFNDTLKTQQHNATINIPLNEPYINGTGLYYYYIACNVSINSEYNVITGDDSDNPAFAIDDAAPETKLMDAGRIPIKEYNSSIPAKDGSVEDVLRLILSCDDNNTLLRTLSNASMAFGCNNTARYYCIYNSSNDCTNTATYTQFTSDIVLNYNIRDGPDKKMYGNNPRIFFYSKDLGGNVEDIKYVQLKLKNNVLENPNVTLYNPYDISKDIMNITARGIDINQALIAIKVNYSDETNVSIASLSKYYEVHKIDSDNAYVPLREDTPLNNTGEFLFFRQYWPNGKYNLTINATDEDGNNNINTTIFYVEAPENFVQLQSPVLGIGTTRFYNINVSTLYDSTCKYSTSVYPAYINLSDWYIQLDYKLFNITNVSENLYHNIANYDGDASGTLYVICKTIDSLDESNKSYVMTSFPVGYLTTNPVVKNITFIGQPTFDPFNSTIINASYNATIIKVITDQDTVCRINGTSTILNVYNMMLNGSGVLENISDYNSYSTTHTLLINYSGRLGSTISGVFNYTINCTNHAQRTIANDTKIYLDLNYPAPSLTYSVNNSYITRKSINVTFNDPYITNYTYSIITNIADPCTYLTSKAFGTILDVKETSKVCVKGVDVLGRADTKTIPITIRNFDSGNVTVISPRYLKDKYILGQTATFDLVIDTDVNATCKYTKAADFLEGGTNPLDTLSFDYIYNDARAKLMNTTNSTSNITGYNIGFGENVFEDLIIICKAANVDPTSSPNISRAFSVAWDNTSSSININAPQLIDDMNNRIAVFDITTDDNTMCYFNGTLFNGDKDNILYNDSTKYVSYKQTHRHTTYYTNPEHYVGNDILYTYNITCINTAGLSGKNNTNIRFKPAINISVTRNSPTLYLTNTSLLVSANTSIQANCSLYVNNTFSRWMAPTSNNKTHNILIDLKDNEYNLNVSCFVNSNISIRGSTNYTVIVDTRPSRVELSANSIMCNLSFFNASLNIISAYGIKNYTYVVYNGLNNEINRTKITSSMGRTYNTLLNYTTPTNVNGEAYSLEVSAIFNDGSTDSKTVSVTTYDPATDSHCDYVNPGLTITNKTINANMAEVNISCTDANSGCKGYSYDIIPVGWDCATRAVYGSLQTFTNNNASIILTNGQTGRLCVKVYDNSVNNNYNTTDVTINTRVAICSNGELDRIDPAIIANYNLAIGSTNDYNEVCDGSNLRINSCINVPHSPAYTAGTLTCNLGICSTYNESQCRQGMPITLTTPLYFGIANKSIYNLTITTPSNSTCRLVTTQLPDPLPEGVTIIDIYNEAADKNLTNRTNYKENYITINATELNDTSLFNEYARIICNNTEPNANETGQAYNEIPLTLGYYANGPTLNITGPSIIRDFNSRIITLTVDTNHPSICYIEGPLTGGAYAKANIPPGKALNKYYDYDYTRLRTLNYMAVVNPLDYDKFRYNISCTDRANLTTVKEYNITYNISQDINITFNMANYSLNSNVEIAVNTSVIANCTIFIDGFNNGTFGANGLIHSKYFTLGSKNNHEIGVQCNIPNTVIYSEIKYHNITVDLQNPTVNISTINTTTCNLESFDVKVNGSDDTTLISYNYTVTSTGISYTSGSINIPDTITFNNEGNGLTDGQVYNIDVYTIDQFGKNSDHKQLAITAHSPNNSITCDSREPTITIGTATIINNTFATVEINCTDSKDVANGISASGCQSKYKYATVPKGDCSGLTESDYKEAEFSNTDEYSSTRKLILYGDVAKLCVRGMDRSGKYAYANKTISLNAIGCGDGIIQIKPTLSDLGYVSSYDNWNQAYYDSITYEYCDTNGATGATNLSGQSCQSLGEGVGGTLSCPHTGANKCNFDTSNCVKGINVILISPLPFGLGQYNNYNLSVGTNNYTSVCKIGELTYPGDTIGSFNYNTMNVMNQSVVNSSINNYTITMNGGEYYYAHKYIICNASISGYTGPVLGTFGILDVYTGYEGTLPNISLGLDRTKLFDWNDRTAYVYINTTDTNGIDENTVCYINDSGILYNTYLIPNGNVTDYSTYSSKKAVYVDFGSRYTNPAYKMFTYNVTCINRAQKNTSKTINLEYNIVDYININKTFPSSQYIGSATTDLDIKTNILARCTVNDGTLKSMDSTLSTTHTTNVNIGNGWKNVTVICTSPFASSRTLINTTEFRFRGSTVGPNDVAINVTYNSCSLNDVNITFNSTDVTGTGIDNYNYSISSGVKDWTIVNTVGGNTHINIKPSVSLVSGSEYTVQATAVDKAGFVSSVTSTTFRALNNTVWQCDNTNPSMTITLQPVTSIYRKDVEIKCTDNYCTTSFDYALIDQSGSCNSATYITKSYDTINTDYSTGKLTIDNTSKVCVKGRDLKGNLGTYELVVTVTDRTSGIIRIIYPTFLEGQYITSNTSVTNVVIDTGVTANCRLTEATGTLPASNNAVYAGSKDFNVTGSTLKIHNITNFTFTNANTLYDWLFICNRTDVLNAPESEAYIMDVYSLMYDATKPTIDSVSSTSVTDRWDKNTELTIITNEPTICYRDGVIINNLNTSKYNDYNTKHIEKISYISLGETSQTFNYNIICMNRAKLNSTSSGISVLYDLNDTLGLVKTAPASSSDDIYLASNSVELQVRTNLLAVCTANNGSVTNVMELQQPSTDQYYYYNIQLSSLSNITNVNVTCVRSGSIDESHKYILHSNVVGPQQPTVSVSPNVCSLTNVALTFNVTDATGVGIREYNYTILNSTLGTAKGWSTITSNTDTATLSLTPDQTYTVQFIATDNAGFKSSLGVGTFIPRAGTTWYCDNTYPGINVRIVSNSIFYKDVNVSCNDNYCNTTFKWDFISQSGTCSGTSTYDKTGYYNQLLSFNNNSGRLCVKGYDYIGHNTYNETSVDIISRNAGVMNITNPTFLETQYIIARSNVTDINLTTDISSDCKYIAGNSSTNDTIAYSGATPFTTTGGTTNHSISGFRIYSQPNEFEDYYFICKRNDIVASESEAYAVKKDYRITYDGTNPVINNYSATDVTDNLNKKTNIRLTTNEPTICYYNNGSLMNNDNIKLYSSYTKDHETIIDYTLTLDNNPHQLNYTLYCMNFVGLNSTKVNISIRYEFTNVLNLTKVRPDGVNNPVYLSINNTELQVKVNMDSSCKYVLNGGAQTNIAFSATTGSEYYYTTTLNNLANSNTISVTCTRSGSLPVSAVYNVYANNAGPTNMNVSANTITTCGQPNVTVTFSATNTGAGIKGFNYTIRDETAGTFISNAFTNSTTVTIDTSVWIAGHVYKIESRAVDNADVSSSSDWIAITSTTSSATVCDNTNPSLTITDQQTSFLDVMDVRISCTDTISGCTSRFNYSLLDANTNNCTGATYDNTELYTNNLTITDRGRLCVKGYDRNNNSGYNTEIVNIMSKNNTVNVTTDTPIPPVNSIYPNTLTTTSRLINVTLTSTLGATCRYGLTPNNNNGLANMYTNYIPFNTSGDTTHIIREFDTQEKYEQLVDVICYNQSLSATPYSRLTLRIVYISSTSTPLIQFTAQPSIVYDWNNRKAKLIITTNQETVCTLTSANDNKNNLPTDIGNYSNALTYQLNHEKDLDYTGYDISIRTFTYSVTCKNLVQLSSSNTTAILYNVSKNISIELISPLNYNSSTVDLMINTSLIANCNLLLDGTDKGALSKDNTGLFHNIVLTGLVNGTYNTEFRCIVPILGVTVSKNYSITVNTSRPRTYCGDGLTQFMTANDNGQYEVCDCPNGICTQEQTRGLYCGSFTGQNFTGQGILRCANDCTAFNKVDCDKGQGYCGDGKIQVNSNGQHEACDGTKFAEGMNCAKLGYTSGELACSHCELNASRCSKTGVTTPPGGPVCSNALLEGEVCEAGSANVTCLSFGYDYGYNNAFVPCTSCRYDLAGCYFNLTQIVTPPGGNPCGNGRLESSEDCDGTLGLNTVSCKSILANNYSIGNVSCKSTCKYDTSKCVDSRNGLSKCVNGVKDITEADVDCGGDCAGCSFNKTCFGNSDCASNKCVSSKCAINTCNNSKFDSAYETDVDCGGTCKPCDNTKSCTVTSDCVSGYCISNKCDVNPCANGILDEGEVDIDCGGSCTLCNVGQKCASSSECSTDSCVNNVCTEKAELPNTNLEELKLILLIFGIVLTLGGTGYIVYRSFFGQNISNGKKPPQSGIPPIANIKTPKQSLEEQRGIQKQKEAMSKRQEMRDSQRKTIIQNLETTARPKKTEEELHKLEEKPTLKKEEKNEEEYVDLSNIDNKKSTKNDKVSSKENSTFGKLKDITNKDSGTKKGSEASTFDKLKNISKSDEIVQKIAQMSGSSKEDIKPALNNKLTGEDALKLFGNLNKEKITSDVFREILSHLIEGGKITKENVSSILFEYMDRGVLTKGEVAKISSELKII